jgi:antitoxin ChpS
MTTVKIDLPDQQAAALAQRAAEQGLSLEDYFRKLAEKEAPAHRRYTAEELVQRCDPQAPPSDEDRAWLDAPPVGREAL